MRSVPLYQHIFYQHLLGLQHTTPQPKEAYELIWPSVFLLLCFLLIVTVKVTSFSKVTRVVQSCFSMQTLRKLEREEYNPFKFYSVALSLFFILNLAFFIYKVNEVYGQVLLGYSRLLQFLFFLLLTMLVFVLRNGLSRVLAISIGDYRLIPEYTYSSFVISQTLGILLFPCLVFAELSHFNPLIFLSSASVILLAMQVFKWYRGIVFALVENRVGLLQIFTYFCSLEILPVLVLVKFIIQKF
jgi:hypothetical protein